MRTYDTVFGSILRSHSEAAICQDFGWRMVAQLLVDIGMIRYDKFIMCLYSYLP